MDRTLEDVRGMVMKELDDIVARGDINEGTLMCLDKLVDIVKDIGEIEDHEEGYSNTGRIPMYPYERSTYNNGNSYRGGRMRYSYSRDNGSTMEKLNRMMNEASSDVERDVIRRLMDTM